MKHKEKIFQVHISARGYVTRIYLALKSPVSKTFLNGQALKQIFHKRRYIKRLFNIWSDTEMFFFPPIIIGELIESIL